MRRKRKRNPVGGLDAMGFLAGAAAPLAVGEFLIGGTEFLGLGTTAVAGVIAAFAGASSPGFFRGAAVGGLLAAGAGYALAKQREAAAEKRLAELRAKGVIP